MKRREEPKEVTYMRKLASIHPADRTKRQQDRYERLVEKYRRK